MRRRRIRRRVVTLKQKDRPLGEKHRATDNRKIFEIIQLPTAGKPEKRYSRQPQRLGEDKTKAKCVFFCLFKYSKTRLKRSLRDQFCANVLCENWKKKKQKIDEPL